MKRAFKQIDVFSDVACKGNPLAVVLGAAGLDDITLQQFANWTNLSETTFLLPPTNPEADYRVRIFTASTELPFAGHPTLGSCHAWLEAGGQPKRKDVIVQECGVGLVKIKHEQGRYAFAAPPRIRTGPLEDGLLARLCKGFNLQREDILGHEWLVNGPQWIGLRLKSAEQVLSVKPDPTLLQGLYVGLVGAYPSGSDCAFELRAFVVDGSPWEDPVTGSLNAAVAQWLIGAGLAPDNYTAAQGTALGRRGRIYVQRDAQGEIWIGGAARTLIEGAVSL